MHCPISVAETGNLTHILLTFLDISENKREEEMLSGKNCY
jgi:hypothetical protein